MVPGDRDDAEGLPPIESLEFGGVSKLDELETDEGPVMCSNWECTGLGTAEEWFTGTLTGMASGALELSGDLTMKKPLCTEGHVSGCGHLLVVWVERRLVEGWVLSSSQNHPQAYCGELESLA